MHKLVSYFAALTLLIVSCCIYGKCGNKFFESRVVIESLPPGVMVPAGVEYVGGRVQSFLRPNAAVLLSLTTYNESLDNIGFDLDQVAADGAYSSSLFSYGFTSAEAPDSRSSSFSETVNKTALAYSLSVGNFTSFNGSITAGTLEQYFVTFPEIIEYYDLETTAVGFDYGQDVTNSFWNYAALGFKDVQLHSERRKDGVQVFTVTLATTNDELKLVCKLATDQLKFTNSIEIGPDSTKCDVIISPYFYNASDTGPANSIKKTCVASIHSITKEKIVDAADATPPFYSWQVLQLPSKLLSFSFEPSHISYDFEQSAKLIEAEDNIDVVETIFPFSNATINNMTNVNGALRFYSFEAKMPGNTIHWDPSLSSLFSSSSSGNSGSANGNSSPTFTTETVETSGGKKTRTKVSVSAVDSSSIISASSTPLPMPIYYASIASFAFVVLCSIIVIIVYSIALKARSMRQRRKMAKMQQRVAAQLA